MADCASETRLPDRAAFDAMAEGLHSEVELRQRPVFDGQGPVVATRAIPLDNELVGITRVQGRRFRWENRAFGRIFGYAAGELVGQETATLFPDRAAFRAFCETSSQALLAGDCARSTLALRHKDGSTVWAEVHGTLLDAEQGETMWIWKDVTAERRVQELERALAELQAQNRQHQETALLHTMLLVNLSHELRTPLNAVIGFAGLMRETGPVQDPVLQERYARQIEHGGRHLLTMIDSVLEVARAGSERPTWRHEQVEPRMLVDEVIGMLEPKARSCDVRLDRDIDPALGPMWLDPLRMKQVLLNYIGNAIKFSHRHGPVTVRARRAPGDRLRVEVEDRGIGISDADQGRLFVRFQQLSAGATPAYEGTGIGLALVKQIVEAQGGQVGLSSRLGAGSVFWAEVPCGAAPAR